MNSWRSVSPIEKAVEAKEMSDTSTPRLNDTPRINVTEAADTNTESTTSEPLWKHISRTSPVVPEDVPEEDVIHLQDSRPRSSSSKGNRSPKMSGSAKHGIQDKKSTNLSVPFSGGKEKPQEITEEMRISTPIQRESTNASLDTESWMSLLTKNPKLYCLKAKLGSKLPFRIFHWD
ncbi:hypothetical protein CHS0354_039670 [Potamilus streckersoni]|uniref:Uncharacterized protein n=1 Tax=Potamilus streckersoni TaxID=2493646 RepID=A0AAE0SK43_9BIVA|nr:hypothetical protein CHS0354_039670 [Potamilus streckersoni]